MIWRFVIAFFLLFMLGPILLVVLFSFGSNALIGFPMGCLYRNRAVHAIESSGRRWHIASMPGVHAGWR